MRGVWSEQDVSGAGLARKIEERTRENFDEWARREDTSIGMCLREAGLPDGVVNFVTGPGRTLGQALVDSPIVDGVTFTGSFDVWMKMYQDFARRNYVRPIILELGGKNPAIVSRHAKLDDAVAGIVRSAFGLQGQKCSAASRVFVEEPVYHDLVARLKEAVDKFYTC